MAVTQTLGTAPQDAMLGHRPLVTLDTLWIFGSSAR